jgi:hypothetical protein
MAGRTIAKIATANRISKMDSPLDGND